MSRRSHDSRRVLCLPLVPPLSVILPCRGRDGKILVCTERHPLHQWWLHRIRQTGCEGFSWWMTVDRDIKHPVSCFVLLLPRTSSHSSVRRERYQSGGVGYHLSVQGFVTFEGRSYVNRGTNPHPFSGDDSMGGFPDTGTVGSRHCSRRNKTESCVDLYGGWVRRGVGTRTEVCRKDDERGVGVSVGSVFRCCQSAVPVSTPPDPLVLYFLSLFRWFLDTPPPFPVVLHPNKSPVPRLGEQVQGKWVV